MTTLRMKLKQTLLLGGDYLAFELALVLTLLLRYQSISSANLHTHLFPFSLLGGLWILCFYIVGLYDLTLTRDSLRFFRMYLEGMVINLGIAVAFFYLIPIFGIAPRTNLLLYFACALLLGYAWRLMYHRLIAPAVFRNRLLFIGHAEDAERIHELLGGSGLGFELGAVVDINSGRQFDATRIAWGNNLSQINQLIQQQNINTVVLAQRPEEVTGLQEALYKTLFTPVTLIDRATLEEALTGRVPLDYVSQSWFLENLRENEKEWYEGAKRLSDVILAIPFGILTCLVYPFVSLGIKLSSPGPILFKQTRVGKYGKTFTLYKFRSMITNSPDGSAEGKTGPRFTADAKTDPRLFTLGRILRQLRIDELPQIWNVLRGDMSLVGPRPERPEFVDQLMTRMPYYALRHLTRPGLTGWAQVRFLTPTASLEDNLKKLQYDLYYIKNRSILLDAAILLKTVGIVLRRQGT